jgi:hypothetical protein
MRVSNNSFLIAAAMTSSICGSVHPTLGDDTYRPVIDPANFSTEIDNPYFPLPTGKKVTFAAQTDSGRERIEINVSGEIRMIMGVKTLVYYDRAFVEGVVHEVTRDFLAQDKFGNIWYFGEEVNNFTNGKLRNHTGSWIAGIDGAQPGIWIKAKLVPGDIYRQEYSKGAAEDMAEVVSTKGPVTIGLGVFTGCAKILEWTPIEPAAKAFKYYCPEAGGLVAIEHLRTGERFELIASENDGKSVH